MTVSAAQELSEPRTEDHRGTTSQPGGESVCMSTAAARIDPSTDNPRFAISSRRQRPHARIQVLFPLGSNARRFRQHRDAATDQCPVGKPAIPLEHVLIAVISAQPGLAAIARGIWRPPRGVQRFHPEPASLSIAKVRWMGEPIDRATSRTSAIRGGDAPAQRKIECGREMLAPSALAGQAMSPGARPSGWPLT